MSKRGFTLIELLVVISIIGILATIVFTSLGGARSKGRDAERLGQMRQFVNALELYHADYGYYPIPDPNAGCGSIIWSDSSCWITANSAPYFANLPNDPLSTDLGNCDTTQGCHIYEYCYIGNDSYVLVINLENKPRVPQPNPSTVGCPNGGPNWYWVKM